MLSFVCVQYSYLFLLFLCDGAKEADKHGNSFSCRHFSAHCLLVSKVGNVFLPWNTKLLPGIKVIVHNLWLQPSGTKYKSF